MAFGLELRDETEVLLSTLVSKSGPRRRWVYEYDFGDGWRHEVLFEGFRVRGPQGEIPTMCRGRASVPAGRLRRAVGLRRLP